MIPVLTAVAALSVAGSAFAGHTAVELYQYFGDPVVSPVQPGAPTNAAPLVNPDVVMNIGDTAWFPIYMELRTGNGRPTLNALGFQVYADGTAGLTNSANTSVSPFAADGSVLAAAAGDGTAHSLGGIGNMLRHTQFHAKTAPSPDPGNGTFFLGWMAVTGNSAGSSDLYLSVSTDAARTYAFATTSATINTLAFGADPTNSEDTDNGQAAGTDQNDSLNGFRLQNVNLDVGVGAGLTSTLRDASITVLPEPTTIGLLGLGLLAIRRRRA
jgi:hypothetical protein